MSFPVIVDVTIGVSAPCFHIQPGNRTHITGIKLEQVASNLHDTLPGG